MAVTAQIVVDIDGFLVSPYHLPYDVDVFPLDVAEYYDPYGLDLNYTYWVVLSDPECPGVVGQARFFAGRKAEALAQSCDELVHIKSRRGFHWYEAYDFPGAVFVLSEHTDTTFAFLDGYEVHSV